MNYDCLIVDDEVTLAESTSEYFSLFGVVTAAVYNASECISFLRENTVQLILLDINLGNDSGFVLCKQLRESTDIPILFISARNTDDDMILAMHIGGDDYIQKPYSLGFLLAKVKAVLKRYSKRIPNQIISFGECTVNLRTGEVLKNGTPVLLKSMEQKLLLYLVKNAGHTVSKEDLFSHVWENSIAGDGTLNVHIRHLREGLEQNPNQPRFIKTVWGIGYLFLLEDGL